MTSSIRRSETTGLLNYWFPGESVIGWLINGRPEDVDRFLFGKGGLDDEFLREWRIWTGRGRKFPTESFPLRTFLFLQLIGLCSRIKCQFSCSA